ncbi:hypothetical protein PGT21_029220 [Puccinia graminis f. sp. tritici]|uniref:VPS37 C-terminal domain-containing protein n=1 Tax=Puccinia graminis f. sp. tritici TaxID=56615 RepID=A0A5B0P1M7_PUCGR|nr:hypothetical protein PGT21_029220 [Puccinia graminis f. sp. tritici]
MASSSTQQQETHNNKYQSTQPTIDDQLSREFPEIGAMSKEDLQDLLNDPDFFHAMLIRQPELKRPIEDHQVAINRNQALAERNLSLRPKLEELRDQVTTSFNQTQQTISQFNDLLKQQADLYQPYGESASRSRLLTALHESDKLTESLANQFVVQGLLEEDQFIKEFREERTRYHKRAWVANRWSEGYFRWN